MSTSKPKNNSFEEIWDALMAAQKILIPLHRSPDPDSYCSAVASALVLTEKGKEVTIVSVDELPDLPSIRSMYQVLINDPADMNLIDYDVFLAQDIASVERYSNKEGFVIPSEVTVINIDHHKTNTQFGQINFVDELAISTAEILTLFYKYVNVGFSNDIANALFMGHASDSGWFTFNPRPVAYDVAKFLVENGADTRKIKAEMDRNSLVNIVLSGLSHSRATYDAEFKYIYSFLTYEDYKKHNVIADQIYSGVQEYKYISDVNLDFSWVAQEKKSGIWNVSFRAKEAHPYDVSRIAVRLNGGGHAAAAGCKVEANSIEEVKETIDSVLEELVD